MSLLKMPLQITRQVQSMAHTLCAPKDSSEHDPTKLLSIRGFELDCIILSTKFARHSYNVAISEGWRLLILDLSHSSRDICTKCLQ